MRWIAVILFCAVLASIYAEPDPKKYKPDVKEKKKLVDTSLTDEERQFLREVESKFGIKSDVPLQEHKSEKVDKEANATTPLKPPFPAVIAIEIVNDTDTKTKGKRTIDANLGYGYRTNNGYTYTYLGKQPKEKGKFMIYPYSQHDIPPSPPRYSARLSHRNHKTPAANVEIQPSQAYELVDANEEKNSYQYTRPSSRHNYESIKGLVSPPQLPQSANPTFYTTYNGHEFSGLSSQFPTVMSNYLVETSQLLKNPQYQSAGINQDYLRSHGSQQGSDRVVPVLVLRVPSSYLKKPTAELYSNTANNYPVSHYLNNVNLQELVNNYFKKIGYSFAPQLMTYQSSVLSEPVTPAATVPTPAAEHYERQHYASPYVNPSYTQADFSGVQYSAVQPVMAKYPSSYSRQRYYIPMMQTHYQQPQQQYEYTYQYVPQSEGQTHYYVQPQYQTQSVEAPASEGKGQAAPVVEVASDGKSGSYVGYQQTASVETTVETATAAAAAEYSVPENPTATAHDAIQQTQYVTSQEASQEYGQPKEQIIEYVSKNTGSSDYASLPYSLYTHAQPSSEYVIPKQSTPKDTLALYETYMSHTVPKYIMNAVKTGMQNYYYQKQLKDESGNGLVLSENYPSKDHTLATVLPVSYTRKSKPASVQTVSYVTPAPHKYQSPFRIMVPQTILRNPATEKVSYVNSHSLPASQLFGQEYNPEAEYTLREDQSPPIAKSKPSYPRNYHSQKRSPKPSNKSDNAKQAQKKSSNSSETTKRVE